MTVIMALSCSTTEQTKGTEKTMTRYTQLLDYLPRHADAKVRFHTSDMILNIHSDAFYLSEEKAQPFFGGGWLLSDYKPIRLNGASPVSTTILRFVVASAAKAELGALYHNCQTGVIF